MTHSLATSVDQDEHTDTDETGVQHKTDSCPECNGQIHPREAQGERLCADCGLVLDDTQIDHGPEWRSYTDGDGDDRSRVGAPVTELLHDKGLSTTIGWSDTDAKGNTLSSRKRRQLQRLRTWDRRFQTKTPQERNLRHALGEIERMAAALGLPKPCRETAAVIYRQAVENGLLPGRSIEGMATASLYAAARQHSSPRTLATFDPVSRVDKLTIQRAYRYLSRELDLGIAPADPVQYLRQYASKLSVNDETEQLATDILETGKRADVQSGRSPAGLAAAAIYAAAHLTNEQLTQATVSEAADVSRVTIRARYQELLEIYGTRDE